MAKSASKVFKSIRFAKLDPDHQKAGPFSTDDEEHYTVSTQEYEQQIKHIKKRSMQEDKDPCWTGYEMVGMKKKNGKPVPNCVPVKEAVKEAGDDPTGDCSPEDMVKKGGKTTVNKPIAEATSVAVRMQRALDRIKAKREASEQRGREVLQPKKPEPVKEDVEQLDELSPNTLHGYMVAGHKKYDSIRNNTDSTSMAKKSKLEAGIKSAHAKKYPAKSAAAEPKKDANSRGYEQGRYMGDSVEHDESLIEGWKKDSGWHKADSKTDTVIDKSGAVHTAHSKVRDLARRAMKDAGAKQAKSVGAKPMKESTLVESRKTDIIKDAADSAKKKKKESDKFEANPTLDSQIQKVDNT